MVATRRLVASYDTPEALRNAFVRHMDANDTEAYIMLRELDYFEQLGALEEHGGFSFSMIQSLLGPRLVDRYKLWQPTIETMGGAATYPLFDRLARKMETALRSG